METQIVILVMLILITMIIGLLYEQNYYNAVVGNAVLALAVHRGISTSQEERHFGFEKWGPNMQKEPQNKFKTFPGIGKSVRSEEAQI